jgi:hypothetical protein
MRIYGFNSFEKVLFAGWSIWIVGDGHFQSLKGGQFASSEVVSLNRYRVITFVVFSTSTSE